jgi:hypothetical protein
MTFRHVTKQLRFTLLALVSLTMVALTAFLSINYSRDYDIYIDIIASHTATDFLFDFFVASGHAAELCPSTIYFFYLSAQVLLLVYFFYSRQISKYWIAIYLLNFYLLHMVTQLRAAMASLLIALFLSSSRPLVRALTLSAPFVHVSSFIFSTAGLARKNWLAIVLSFVAPIVALLIYQPENEKLLLYAVDNNETTSTPFGLFAFIAFVSLVMLSKIDCEEKLRVLSIMVITMIIYIIFIDYKAISNRFLEMSFAILLLYTASIDTQLKIWASNRTLTRHSYKILMLISLGSFYIYSLRGSVLNF